MTQPPNPQGSNAPLNERLAELVLKIIAAGGLTAGGGNALWQLIKDDGNIPKGIASLVIGVGLAWGAKLLMPIHLGTQVRLEKTGETIDQTINQSSDRVITHFSGFESWYLQCQVWDCQSYRTEGMAQYTGIPTGKDKQVAIFSPMLEEVFVPLALDFSGTVPGFRAALLEQDLQASVSSTHLDIWHFLRQADKNRTFRQLVILAWGGYGKTTLLKHIAYIYGTRQHIRHNVKTRIPILLVLRKYRDLLAQDNPPNLPTLITNYHIPNLPREGREMSGERKKARG